MQLKFYEVTYLFVVDIVLREGSNLCFFFQLKIAKDDHYFNFMFVEAVETFCMIRYF